MKKNPYHIFIISAVLLVLCFSCSKKETEDNLSSRTKIALRAVGNDLLLSQSDTTSLVLPVVQISESTYHLSFENAFTFDPTDLYTSMGENSKKAGLPQNYSVEVLRCSDGEVGYSYLLTGEEPQSIIPCGGRVLPESCYTVQLEYLGVTNTASSSSPFFYFLVFLVLAFLVVVFYSKYYSHKAHHKHIDGTVLGNFYFYPDQNKLVTASTEIPLSKKECELLEILAASPNQIVKRESLEKQVWEDQGVIVGRSLDTYISKLRKKLQGDATLKITNVHGVGYKLETLA